ncbi:hypothetical protein ISCGN_019260 [Ixodes scapularis]
MKFAIFLPPKSEAAPVPLLYWLSGLTCTEQNFIQKAGAQKYASELSLAIVCPDTSPRRERAEEGAGPPRTCMTSGSLCSPSSCWESAVAEGGGATGSWGGGATWHTRTSSMADCTTMKAPGGGQAPGSLRPSCCPAQRG